MHNGRRYIYNGRDDRIDHSSACYDDIDGRAPIDHHDHFPGRRRDKGNARRVLNGAH